MRKEYFTIVAVLLVATTAPVVLGQSTCVTCVNCPLGNEVTAALCPAGTAGCFRMELPGGGVNRGCASALTAAEVTECQTGTGTCRICPLNNCNSQADFTRCHRCDSITGEGCAGPQTASVNTQTCMAYVDECGTMIDGDRTIRGCIAEMNFPATCNALTCSRCTGNFCNSGIFPTNRLQCNYCTGNEDSCMNEIVGQTIRRVCDNYVSANDQCYTALDENKNVHRGCLSDTGAGVTACANNQCSSCFQSGCNSIAARWTPTLSCITCAPTDVLCAWGFPPTEAVACTNQVFLGQTESCFQRKMINGNALRGCSLDQPGNACATGDANCLACEGFGCNRMSYNHHHCYQCRSSSEESCRNRVEEDLEVEQCPGNEQRKSDQGCYTLVQDDGHVVRGCLRYLDEGLMAECRAGERCEICNEDGCNHLPAGAMALKAFSAVLLAAIAALCMNVY